MPAAGGGQHWQRISGWRAYQQANGGQAGAGRPRAQLGGGAGGEDRHALTSRRLRLQLSHGVLGTVCPRPGRGCPSEQCPAVAGLHRCSSPVATALNPHRRPTAQCPPRAVCALQALASGLPFPRPGERPVSGLTFPDPLPPPRPQGVRQRPFSLISADALSHVMVSNVNEYLPSVGPCCGQNARHPASPRSWGGRCATRLLR